MSEVRRGVTRRNKVAIMELSNQNTGEIVLYQPDETIRLEVMVDGETVWLTQAQMAELFLTTKQNVSLHINNAIKEGEIEPLATVKDYLTVQNEGEREVSRIVKHYNLDVIISVGYRVKSLRGVSFRRWAREILKEYMLKGFVINHRIERVERLAIETKQEVAEIKIKLGFLTQYVEDVLSGNNDINEDMRAHIEAISQQVFDLQSKQKLLEKPRNRIGYQPSEI